MLVFVDESGDSGLKLDSGSSRFFVLCMVLFDDVEEAQKLEKRIELLRHELNLHPRFEFHFSKLKPSIRTAFLQAVAAYDFQIFGVIIQKSKLYGEGFKHVDSFWKYVSRMTLTHIKPYIENAKFVIDGRGDRRFRKQLSSYLKRHGNEGRKNGLCRIRKVSLEDSHRNDLLQLADMAVGALARRYRDQKKGTNEYWKLIAHNAGRIQIWPQ